MRSKNKKEADNKSFLASLSDEQLKVLASDIRADILSAVNVNGGHLSSNLGTVELTMALLRAFDPLEDDILFDVGHQTYAYKILTNRKLTKLRRFGGEPPFSDRFSSPYDKYLNGHAATSISVGLGMDIAKRLENKKGYTISIIGDSSVSSGLSMEALNLLSTMKDSKLIVVINDNGMSIGKDIGFMARKFQKFRNSRFYFRTSNALGRAMSKSKPTWKLFLHLRNLKDKIKHLFIKQTVFEAIGLKYIGPFDGHDFMHLDLAFRKAKSIAENSSVIVHIITKKGFGYPEAALDKSGDYHGVAPYFAEPASVIPKKDFVFLKSEELENLMEKDEKVYIISPAMEKGSRLEVIFNKYPNRTIDVGIAEENAVSLASGLALKGLKPVVDIYSSFMQRSYDEIAQDIAREKVSALFLVERAGLAGGDGSSHHGIYDVAMVRSIPYSKVYMPFDAKTNHDLFEKVAFQNDVPVFIRYTKEKVIDSEGGDYQLDYVKYQDSNAPSLVIGIGSNGYKLALKFMSDNSVDLTMLVNLLPNDEILDKINLLKYQKIFVYDSYGIKEGTCSVISDYLLKRKYRGEFVPYAFDNDFVTFGEDELILKSLSLDIKFVYQDILEKTKSE